MHPGAKVPALEMTVHAAIYTWWWSCHRVLALGRGKYLQQQDHTWILGAPEAN